MDHQVNSVEIDMFAPVVFLCFCIGGIRGIICFCIRGSTSHFAPDIKIFNILVHCFLFSSSSRAAKT